MSLSQIEAKTDDLLRDISTWFGQNISSEMLRSQDNMPDVLKMVVKAKQKQLEEITAIMQSNSVQGLRLSKEEGDELIGDVWLYVWPDKSIDTTPVIHGYEKSTGTFYIVEGTAHEDIYGVRKKEDNNGIILAIKTPSFPTEGSTVLAPAHYIHSLAGVESGGKLITLNGFVPALRKVEIFREEVEGINLSLKKVRTIDVDSNTHKIDLSPE